MVLSFKTGARWILERAVEVGTNGERYEDSKKLPHHTKALTPVEPLCRFKLHTYRAEPCQVLWLLLPLSLDFRSRQVQRLVHSFLNFLVSVRYLAGAVYSAFTKQEHITLLPSALCSGFPSPCLLTSPPPCHTLLTYLAAALIGVFPPSSQLRLSHSVDTLAILCLLQSPESILFQHPEPWLRRNPPRNQSPIQRNMFWRRLLRSILIDTSTWYPYIFYRMKNFGTDNVPLLSEKGRDITLTSSGIACSSSSDIDRLRQAASSPSPRSHSVTHINNAMGIREPWAGHQDGLPLAALSRNLQCPVLAQKPHIVAAARYPPSLQPGLSPSPLSLVVVIVVTLSCIYWLRRIPNTRQRHARNASETEYLYSPKRDIDALNWKKGHARYALTPRILLRSDSGFSPHMPDIVSNPSRATEIFAKKQGTIHARWQLVDFPPAIPGLPPTHSLQHSRLALLAGRLLRLFFLFQDSDTTDLVSPSASISSNTPISLETNYEMTNARCKKTNFLLALLFLLATLRPKLPASASGAKCPSHGSRPVPAQGPSMMLFADGGFGLGLSFRPFGFSRFASPCILHAGSPRGDLLHVLEILWDLFCNGARMLSFSGETRPLKINEGTRDIGWHRTHFHVFPKIIDFGILVMRHQGTNTSVDAGALELGTQPPSAPETEPEPTIDVAGPSSSQGGSTAPTHAATANSVSATLMLFVIKQTLTAPPKPIERRWGARCSLSIKVRVSHIFKQTEPDIQRESDDASVTGTRTKVRLRLRMGNEVSVSAGSI
ncbi:uncharacterized protein CLUP02_05296 [Colletotrichum lupini]|uniref:Uncharacterized protein n=1 Tax=Colletotrichum lupini TaxID=145971 RepID=A0A9Q8SLY9_9PEZI|nr:uncharacterized protein CLUP02_05296 [Colletotrichum lupini]UQC79816.1 hypothetical protein CLUP02_05296 [Colletotrichum lupini]